MVPLKKVVLKCTKVEPAGTFESSVTETKNKNKKMSLSTDGFKALPDEKKNAAYKTISEWFVQRELDASMVLNTYLNDEN